MTRPSRRIEVLKQNLTVARACGFRPTRVSNKVDYSDRKKTWEQIGDLLDGYATPERDTRQ